MSKRRSYEEQATDIDAQIARLRERKREVLARNGEEERKGASRAAFLVGELVIGAVPGGWHALDWDRLARIVESNSHIFARASIGDGRNVTEAWTALREWERVRRTKAAEAEVGAHEGGEL